MFGFTKWKERALTAEALVDKLQFDLKMEAARASEWRQQYVRLLGVQRPSPVHAPAPRVTPSRQPNTSPAPTIRERRRESVESYGAASPVAPDMDLFRFRESTPSWSAAPAPEPFASGGGGDFGGGGATSSWESSSSRSSDSSPSSSDSSSSSSGSD